jgi:Arc/MetJ family transcription regulator
MRANIEIDDALLQRATEATGQTTKRAAVEAALRTLVRFRKEIAWLRKFAQTDEAKRACPGHVTRTNIEIDERLMKQALQAAEVATRRGAVDEALRLVVRLHRQKQALENLRGIGWEGDLDQMRTDWSSLS